MATRDGAPPINELYDQAHAAAGVLVMLYGWSINSLTMIAVGIGMLGLLAAARSDYGYYSIKDVGRYGRVQNRTAETTSESCAVCGSPADGGEEVRTITEVVAFGIVILREDAGSRHYCDEHGSVAVIHGFGEDVPESGVEALELAREGSDP